MLRTGVLKIVNKLVCLTLQDIYAVRTSMSKCGDWIDRCKKKEKAFFLIFFLPHPLVFVRKVIVCKLCGENAVQNAVHFRIFEGLQNCIFKKSIKFMKQTLHSKLKMCIYIKYIQTNHELY